MKHYILLPFFLFSISTFACSLDTKVKIESGSDYEFSASTGDSIVGLDCSGEHLKSGVVAPPIVAALGRLLWWVGKNVARVAIQVATAKAVEHSIDQYNGYQVAASQMTPNTQAHVVSHWGEHVTEVEQHLPEVKAHYEQCSMCKGLGVLLQRIHEISVSEIGSQVRALESRVTLLEAEYAEIRNSDMEQNQRLNDHENRLNAIESKPQRNGLNQFSIGTTSYGGYWNDPATGTNEFIIRDAILVNDQNGENQVVIYEIADHADDDLFFADLYLFDGDSETKIEERYLEGDVGARPVTGGVGKRIIWHSHKQGVTELGEVYPIIRVNQIRKEDSRKMYRDTKRLHKLYTKAERANIGSGKYKKLQVKIRKQQSKMGKSR
jgi:hypothetical protein